ncbi:hypothetical protein M413DRAFT_27332 [Hebeloma cylindrosporum]|uniref:Uncharacterized protein n=1 Tax=Hebeloma cylindrosporum TaxID=76867 RepID=A0A0C2YL51_HEBCY|nr:hypothetical protein M413DRAFT_27332 [Hebeloma cylindrosporum h7]
MAINKVRKLNGLVEGEILLFQVDVPICSNFNVLDLKRLAWEDRKGGLLGDYGVENLVLLKVNTTVELKPFRTLSERVPRLDADAFEPLDDASAKVSSIFPLEKISDVFLDFVVRFVPESLLRMLTGLHEQISLLPDNPTYYSNPAHVIELPFPSINEIPERFTVSPNSSISFMGRACFDTIWQGFLAVKETPWCRQSLYLYGSKGYGKTHLLLALACLLVRHGHHVVYLPDCRAMLHAPVTYIRNALLFALADPASSMYRARIYHCETLQALARVCNELRYALGGPTLCFVVDEIDIFKPEPGDSRDELKFKYDVRSGLAEIAYGHFEIGSSMANYQSSMRMPDMEHQNIPLLGGLTTEEMSFWWKHHAPLFTKFTVADKQRIEDLTGCLPVLLETFVAHPGDPLAALEPGIWDEPPLSTVIYETMDFAQETLRSNLNNEWWVCLFSPGHVSMPTPFAPHSFNDTFVPAMNACLTPPGGYISNPNIIDHRYFYVDDKHRGHYTCGLAREAIIQFFRLCGEDNSLWLNSQTMKSCRNNPSALGFTVEHLVISKIAERGLHSDDFNTPPAEIVAFASGSTSLSKDRAWGYYVPLKFNRKVVDVVFASIDQEQRTARVVGIQITVSKQLKDAEAAFFAELDRWLCELGGFKVETSFVWIYEGNRDRAEIEVALIEEGEGSTL